MLQSRQRLGVAVEHYGLLVVIGEVASNSRRHGYEKDIFPISSALNSELAIQKKVCKARKKYKSG